MSVLAKIIERLTASPRVYNLCQWALEGDYHRVIVDTVKISPDDSLLDMGSGTGYFSQFFHCHYCGIDNNMAYIAAARRAYANERLEFHEGDVRHTNFPDKSFDFVILVNIIHHLSDADLRLALVEARRLARRSVYIIDVTTKSISFLTSLLLALDNGKYMRSLTQQREIISSVLFVEKYFTFQAPRRLLLHTAVICQV